MRFRTAVRALMTAVLVLTASTPVYAQSASAPAEQAAISNEDLLRATALDEVFAEFGAGIAQAPQEQGIPFTAAMQTAWTAAAHEVFDATQMQHRLAQTMADKFSADDYRAYADFFGAEFGQQITVIERAIASLPAARQLEARDVGIGLAGAAAGSTRAGQIDEMLDLVSADIAKAMIRQSVRGMLLGLSMAGGQGDIEISWEDIDAQMDAIMPELEADIALTQRAMMFFAYRELGEAELEAYLQFLRTDSARKLYAVAAFAIGQIVADRMERFGVTLSRKLDQVNT